MDFKAVLKELLTSFDRQNVRYALIGGLAMGAWGVARGTVDIDFLVRRDDMNKVDLIMFGFGYECRHRSENVSQYVSPLKVFGEVDFLHAFRTASMGMLERAEEREVFGVTMRVRVVRVEDLIGLKVQAIANDPTRKASDIADIESLMIRHRERLDWELVEDYFTLFGFEEIFSDLKRRMDAH